VVSLVILLETTTIFGLSEIPESSPPEFEVFEVPKKSQALKHKAAKISIAALVRKNFFMFVSSNLKKFVKKIMNLK